MTAQKLFGTRDLYQILQLSDMLKFMKVFSLFSFIVSLFHCFLVKRSFYKLALMYHPDRVSEDQKDDASAKFSILHNAYTILSDPEKKKQYDEGVDVLFVKTSIAAQWENFLKPVIQADNDNAKRAYQDSDKEEIDLIREFKLGNGSMTHLLNTIPFMRVEDENRVIESLQQLMLLGKVPKLRIKKTGKK